MSLNSRHWFRVARPWLIASALCALICDEPAVEYGLRGALVAGLTVAFRVDPPVFTRPWLYFHDHLLTEGSVCARLPPWLDDGRDCGLPRSGSRACPGRAPLATDPRPPMCRMSGVLPTYSVNQFAASMRWTSPMITCLSSMCNSVSNCPGRRWRCRYRGLPHVRVGTGSDAARPRTAVRVHHR